MARISALIYGLICYAIFLGTFLYAIWFVYSMDSLAPEPGSSWVTALIIDAAVLALFAIQHSTMARPGFKRVWTKLIPHPIERSTYVLLASGALILMYAVWQPLPGIIWNVESPALRGLLRGLFGLGWLTVLVATFLINHFDLFGLRQVWTYFQNRSYEPLKFRTPGFYRFVRHPIYLGFIIAFWSTPTMTMHHFFFSFMTFAYILVAIKLEERDLITYHGEPYQIYRSGVSMLVPWPPRK